MGLFDGVGDDAIAAWREANGVPHPRGYVKPSPRMAVSPQQPKPVERPTSRLAETERKYPRMRYSFDRVIIRVPEKFGAILDELEQHLGLPAKIEWQASEVVGVYVEWTIGSWEYADFDIVNQRMTYEYKILERLKEKLVGR